MSNWLKIRLAFVFMFLLCVGFCLWVASARGQWPPAATYMSEEQLEATSDLFRRRKALPVPQPGDLCDDLERIAKDVEKVREALCE